MKKTRLIHFALIFPLMAFLAGCSDKAPTDSPADSPQPEAPAATDKPQPDPSPVGPSLAPPVLVGRYAMSEVRHSGQVSMVNESNVTEIVFTSTGSYVREAKRGGRVDHTDSGDFRVNNDGSLVLRMQMSDGKLKIPASERRYEFTLTSNGDELILKGSEGREAVFRRKSGS